MFNLLIDTCVWLDIAREPKQHVIIGVVEEMRRRDLVRLVVPSVVLGEFRRNRERIEKESAKSLTSHFRLVKDAVTKAGEGRRQTKHVLAVLDDVNHRIPIVGGAAVQALDRIEKLLTEISPIEASDPITLRAASRAVQRKAPFHRDRNSIADAIILETYAECLNGERSRGSRFAFVTHNKLDFSEAGGNQKLPHADIAPLFSRIRSLYFVNLVEALRRVDPSLVTEAMFELSFDQEPRGLHEILAAEETLYQQVWYNRHQNLRWKIKNGQHRLVSQQQWEKDPDPQNTTLDSVWNGAVQAAKRAAKRLGKGNTGPWDDFEWGMINGKLSALRWVLGDEWDMLDT